MAMRNIEHIVAELARGGLAPDTPAAVIVAATTPEQRVHRHPGWTGWPMTFASSASGFARA